MLMPTNSQLFARQGNQQFLTFQKLVVYFEFIPLLWIWNLLCAKLKQDVKKYVWPHPTYSYFWADKGLGVVQRDDLATKVDILHMPLAL